VGCLGEPRREPLRLINVDAGRSAAAAAVIALAAGCTSPTHHQQAGRHPHQVQQASSVTSNKVRAQHEADRLLSLARVPPGAIVVTTAPPRLSIPAMGPSDPTGLVRRVRFWRVPTSLDATRDWLLAHPPSGLTHSVGSNAGGPAFAVDAEGWEARAIAGATQDEELLFSFTNLGHGSAIRADATVAWLDPRPVRDTIVGSRPRLDLKSGCVRSDARAVSVRNDDDAELSRSLLPAAHPVRALVCAYTGTNRHPAFRLIRKVVLNRAVAARLAAAVRMLPLAHPDGRGPFSCAADFGTATVLVFGYAGQRDVDLWVDVGSSCAMVRNGVIATRALLISRTIVAAQRSS